MLIKIKNKIRSKSLLEYIIWKVGILKVKELLLKKYFHKEVSRWFADDGDSNLRFNYQIDQNGLIIDVGSYTGQDLKKFLNKFNCSIYGFEPSFELFQQLEKSFNTNLVRIYNFGFSSQIRT